MEQEPGDHGREARIAGYLRLLAPLPGSRSVQVLAQQ